MKRVGYLYEQVYTIENLILAFNSAKKGKSDYKIVQKIEKNKTYYILKLQEMLKDMTYIPAKYKEKPIKDKGKNRVIHKTKFFPDRIIHHAVIQIVFPTIEKLLITHTYQSLPRRGCHKGKAKVQEWIKERIGKPTYVAKLDIEKFYPSVLNTQMKLLFRRKFKDSKLLWILDTIIDSISGLPIGNYTSQIFGNMYLAYMDHYAKEVLKVKYYIRYADDIVLFDSCKSILHSKVAALGIQLKCLGLKLGKSCQVFLLSIRKLDYLGYVFDSKGIIKVRKRIKLSFIKKCIRKCKTVKDIQGINSLLAWLSHCESKWLIKKYLTNIVYVNMCIVCSQENTTIPKSIKRVVYANS